MRDFQCIKTILIGMVNELTVMIIIFRTNYYVLGISKKVKWLNDNRIKGFCLIIKSSFDFNIKHFYLDFGTKFVKIQYELIKIHKFQY